MRWAFSGCGRTKTSISPVKRGAPWKAKANPPTMRYSTFCSFNNTSSSLKSGCISLKLPAKDFDRADALFGRAAQPVGEISPRGAVTQAVLGYDELNHGGSIADLRAQETLFPLARTELSKDWKQAFFQALGKLTLRVSGLDIALSIEGESLTLARSGGPATAGPPQWNRQAWALHSCLRPQPNDPTMRGGEDTAPPS